eukprot:CAMPEP_0206510954 /NCGR_PEP_ID=MMETSP0324_2-20121206/60007_1 /ASSEMBLY_ACC=CAM_ASM_000836 /TAXON_ID=2866 /ORGANISM="Crypthecodinium cohnii, Strain Seligo" /LENGTH=91 /DNA_ID=CAMNT_0054002651 /DNA_START=275 /DNA_END=551 /DNA_ORIENTATION=-
MYEGYRAAMVVVVLEVKASDKNDVDELFSIEVRAQMMGGKEDEEEGYASSAKPPRGQADASSPDSLDRHPNRAARPAAGFAAAVSSILMWG